MSVKVAKRTVLSGIIVATVIHGAAMAATELAKVNGRPITDGDLKTALSNLNEGQRQSVLKDPNSRRQVLVSVIDQEVLAQEAEKQKLDQDAEFKEAMAVFRKQLLASKILQKNLSAKLTDAAAKKYYQSHKYKYSTDQVHAQHILVDDEKRAQELLKQAKAAGTDFQELAEKNSKDPSAKNNRGDLGFFGRDRMVAEFADAAFGADEGAVVGPVKTAYGYHVIKVIQKKIGKPLEFSEVELRVQTDLKQEAIAAFVSKLRETAKIQVDDKAVEKL